MSANEKQVGGDHYKGGIELWDFITANAIGYLEGNAIKYISRWRKKNGLEDLRKARHYLDKIIELEEKRCPGQTTEEVVARSVVRHDVDVLGKVSETVIETISGKEIDDWFCQRADPDFVPRGDDP